MSDANLMQLKKAEGNLFKYHPTYSKALKIKKQSSSDFSLNLAWLNSLNFSAHFNLTGNICSKALHYVAV